MPRQDLKEALDEAQSAHNSAVKRLEYEYQLAVAESNEARSQDCDKWKNGPNPNDIATAEARLAAAKCHPAPGLDQAPSMASLTLVLLSRATRLRSMPQAFRLDGFVHHVRGCRSL
jgi:hypothetical protein